jgi:predicted dehydrogenase
MERIPIAIVGCGGMGGRHLRGVAELYGSSHCNIELVAACDLRRDNAEHLADDAEALLGARPRAFTSMEAMVQAIPELQAVDITTDSGSHHLVVKQALDLGLHMLCEKPLASTIRGCNLCIEAWEGSGKVLSVAENFRRDPLCRLVRALVDAGAVGRPYMMFAISASGGNHIIIFPWRHVKTIGGIVVDGGVHTIDLMQYYLGDVREIYARAQVLEPIRYRSAALTPTSPFYEHWFGEMPEQMEATAEDTLASVMTFESGVMGQWTAFHAAHGQGFGFTAIYGSEGSLRTPGARNGRPPTLHRDDGGEVPTAEILDLVPDFQLEPLAAELFGGDRLAGYDFSFAQADRKLIALEYHELAECVRTGASPEVDPYVARRDLAVCHAALESSLLNRPVTIAEIEAEETAEYEAEIVERWGL